MDSKEQNLIVSNNKVDKTNNVGKMIVKKIKTIGKKIKLKNILIIAFLIVLVIFLFNLFKSDEVNYRIAYVTSDGDMYIISDKDKDESKAIKLANKGSVGDIVYANTTNRYVLFKKKGALYLYNAKKKDETTKIADDVLKYEFTDDDKYIVMIDSDKKLRVYNYKKSETIDSNVDDYVSMHNNKIVYKKDGKLYIRSLNYKKDDKQKIAEDYSNVTVTEDGKKVLYIDQEKNLKEYIVGKKKDNKIASNVTSYYCDTESCNQLFYIADKDGKTVHYYDGKTSTKVAKDIYSISDFDTEKKEIVYTVLDKNKYTLYYQKVDKEAARIEKDLTSIRMVKLFEGKEIYYINGKNEVRYAKISGNKVSSAKTIGEDVTGSLFLNKDGYAFVGNVDSNSNGTLYVAKNGKAKKIDTNVNNSILFVNTKGDKLYYYKDYSNSAGSLYVLNGSKPKKIDEEVYAFEYIKDNLIYYLKDFNLSSTAGDLYRYTGKNEKIAENVVRISNTPVYYTAK